MTIAHITITPEDKRKWIETRAAITWTAPAFTHILMSMLNPTKGELAAVFTEDVPIAATDGSNLILNPKTYFKYNLAKRVFIGVHEIFHCMWNHCALSRQYRTSGKVKYNDGTELPYDAQLMNVAMDLVINDALIQAKIGEFPGEGVHDPKIATAKDSFLDAYKKVWKQKPQGGGGFDVLLDPGAAQGKHPDQAVQDRSQTAWDTAIASAMAAAKAQGKLPAVIEKLFTDMLEPAASWQDLIRAFFARKVGAGSYDWRKPDRRLIQRDIYAPQRSGSGCGTVVVGFDTSGSIYARPELLNHFIAEVSGILADVRPDRLVIVWCDAKVHRIDEVDDMTDLLGLMPVGGGGTDFRPVFDWIEENDIRPEALVYLTDGEGDFPREEPRYPVLWGSILERSKYPFGEVVQIKR